MADNQGTGWMYNPDGEINKVKETENFNSSTRLRYTIDNSVEDAGCSPGSDFIPIPDPGLTRSRIRIKRFEYF